MTYQSEVLTDSPWGLWMFGETSGTALADASPNARTANILAGSPVLGQPGPGSAAAIDWPTTSYAQTSATLAEPTTSTYEAWVYLTAAPGQVTPLLVVAPTSGSSGNTSGLLLQSDGRVTAFHYPGAPFNSPSPLTFNVWHHLVVSTGAAGSKIRVDKVTVATSATTSDQNAGTGPLWFHAYRNGASVVNGGPVRMAAPAFWTSQLSDARTDAHYDAMLAAGGGTLSITLAGALPAIQAALTLSSYTDTTTGNRANGRLRNGGFVDESVEPVEPLPANLVRAAKVDKALAYPTPTLVDGRPT